MKQSLLNIWRPCKEARATSSSEPNDLSWLFSQELKIHVPLNSSTEGTIRHSKTMSWSQFSITLSYRCGRSGSTLLPAGTNLCFGNIRLTGQRWKTQAANRAEPDDPGVELWCPGISSTNRNVRCSESTAALVGSWFSKLANTTSRVGHTILAEQDML